MKPKQESGSVDTIQCRLQLEIIVVRPFSPESLEQKLLRNRDFPPRVAIVPFPPEKRQRQLQSVPPPPQQQHLTACEDEKRDPGGDVPPLAVHVVAAATAAEQWPYSKSFIEDQDSNASTDILIPSAPCIYRLADYTYAKKELIELRRCIRRQRGRRRYGTGRRRQQGRGVDFLAASTARLW